MSSFIITLQILFRATVKLFTPHNTNVKADPGSLAAGKHCQPTCNHSNSESVGCHGRDEVARSQKKERKGSKSSRQPEPAAAGFGFSRMVQDVELEGCGFHPGSSEVSTSKAVNHQTYSFSQAAPRSVC